jgi:hypothetical protein
MRFRSVEYTSHGRQRACAISTFAQYEPAADRPIIDETGISGNFEFANLELGQFRPAAAG